jgi:hypothetical protein
LDFLERLALNRGFQQLFACIPIIGKDHYNPQAPDARRRHVADARPNPDAIMQLRLHIYAPQVRSTLSKVMRLQGVLTGARSYARSPLKVPNY